jgi:hypothetical protein
MNKKGIIPNEVYLENFGDSGKERGRELKNKLKLFLIISDSYNEAYALNL